jgi:signal transduction histidine kinase/ActR/RegA family two-component response regulator
MEDNEQLFPDDQGEVIARLGKDGTLTELIVETPHKLLLDPQALVGQHFSRLVPARLQKVILPLVDRALETGQPQRFVFQSANGAGQNEVELKLAATGPDQLLATLRRVADQPTAELDLLQVNRSFIALQAAATAVNASLELDHVLESFTWEMTKLLRAGGCAVFQWHQDSKSLSLMAGHQHGLPPGAPAGKRRPLDPLPLTLRTMNERYASQITLSQYEARLPEHDYMRECGIASLLMVPIVFHNQVIGLVEIVERDIERIFREHEVSLAQLLTSEAAGAIVNARLYQLARQEIAERKRAEAALERERSMLAVRVTERTAQLQTQSQRQSALAAIEPTISHPEELTNVLKQIVDIIAAALPADAGASIVLWNREQKRFVNHVSSEGSVLGTDFLRGHRSGGLSRRILDSQQVLAVPDVLQSPYHDPDWFEASELRSYVGAPIFRHEQGLGIIYAASRLARDYSQEELEFLQALANRAAVAITNVQLYEALQDTNNELARLARMKDDFLTNMSHELRTPLNAILGIAEGLQEQFYGPLNEKQIRSAQIIEESGKHLLNLINDILDVSKIEAGQLNLEIEQVFIRDSCEGSLNFVKRPALKKNITLSLDIDPQVRVIQADSRRLKQILVNLLDNAIKFTPDDGAVGLQVTADPAGKQVQFTVWDTGIGLSPENLAQLFQPFVQVESSLTRRYSGTGLGLVLVKHMTEMHGGSVAVESEVGRGSRFSFWLPWEPGEQPGLSPADDPAAMITLGQAPSWKEVSYDETPTLLLVDDDKDNRELFSGMLATVGFRVLNAGDGREAVEKTAAEKPDLILMDIQMPEMDGLEAIRRIRALPDVAQVPIIALTALAMKGDRELCLEAGANDYLSKPIALRKLVKAIRSQLEPADQQA